MIDPSHRHLSVARQCKLLGLARSSFYYAPLGASAEALALMHRLDELYTQWPFYGVRKMAAHLTLREGFLVNVKRVRRLLRRMGIMALYAAPRTTLSAAQAARYPYLLRDLKISHPNHVWAVDITYVRLRSGFLYLFVVLDLFSRYVLDWQLSNSLETGFCLETMGRALGRATPDICNSDQGVQFTSEGWSGLLLNRKVHISMDGRGRAIDNVFAERLWRSVKQEEIYLHDYANGIEAWQGLQAYFVFYNTERIHEALAYRTPAEVYFSGASQTTRMAA